MPSISISNKTRPNLTRPIGSLIKKRVCRSQLRVKPNYDNIYQYRDSKKFFNVACYDLEMDKPPEGHKINIYDAQNDLAKSEFRLVRAKKNAIERKELIRKEWIYLERKENELRESFISFNRFLRKNDNKRKRTEQVIINSKNSYNTYANEMGNMKSYSVFMKKVMDLMNEHFLKYRIYEQFLMEALDVCNFKNINEMLNRFSLLQETKHSLANTALKTNVELETARDKYSDNFKQQEVIFFEFSNQLSDLGKKYDSIKRDTIYWESVLKSIVTRYTQICENIIWTKMALNNLFEMSYYHMRIEYKKAKNDFERTLRIDNTLKALEKINEKLGRLYNEEHGATTILSPLSFEDSQSNVQSVSKFKPEEFINWKYISNLTASVRKSRVAEDDPSSHSGDSSGLLETKELNKMYKQALKRMAFEKKKLDLKSINSQSSHSRKLNATKSRMSDKKESHQTFDDTDSEVEDVQEGKAEKEIKDSNVIELFEDSDDDETDLLSLCKTKRFSSIMIEEKFIKLLERLNEKSSDEKMENLLEFKLPSLVHQRTTIVIDENKLKSNASSITTLPLIHKK